MRSWGNCGRERRSEAADRYRFPAVARSPSASEAPSRPPALYVRIDCAILDAARGFCDPADFGPARGRGGDCLVSKAFDWRPTTHGSASASRLVRPLGCRLLGDGGLQRGSLVFGRVPVRSTARTRLIWSQLWSQCPGLRLDPFHNLSTSDSPCANCLRRRKTKSAPSCGRISKGGDFH